MDWHIIKQRKVRVGDKFVVTEPFDTLKKGDEIIIMAFTWTDEEIIPQPILVDEENKFVQFM